MQEYYLGVDMGGTKTNIAKGNANGEITDIRRFTFDQSCHKKLVEDILNAIETYITENCSGAKILGIGMGLKGHVLYRSGIWERCITIPDFSSINICEIAENRFGVPAFADNDVHAATLAELYFGAGKKYRDFIYYNIGTGIGIGMVFDGKLIHGSTNYSGEIGHMVTESEGKQCSCGHFGCLEEVSGGAAIINQAREGLADFPDSSLAEYEKNGTLTSHSVFAEADKGDELAAHIADRVEKSLNLSLVAIANICNPEAIVFGGGVVSDGWLVPKLEKYVKKYPLKPAAEAIKAVEISNIGSGIVGVLGACAVAMDGLKRRIISNNPNL